MGIRGGPKFRSSAEEFGGIFGSATCDYSANFGKNLASFVALHLWRFALAAEINFTLK